MLGECPRYLDFAGDGLVKFTGVPYELYPILLKQFDVLLCAVDTRDEFSQCKSAVKALECMAIGVVPICSQFEPYIELHTAGAPLVLVEEDTRDGWYEAMRRVVSDPEYLEALRSMGPAWVRANRDMCRTGYKLWEAFYRRIREEK